MMYSRASWQGKNECQALCSMWALVASATSLVFRLPNRVSIDHVFMFSSVPSSKVQVR